LKNPRFGRLSAPHLQLVNSGFSNCASLDLEVFRDAHNKPNSYKNEKLLFFTIIVPVFVFMQKQPDKSTTKHG
jgi:hypothetical protein